MTEQPRIIQQEFEKLIRLSRGRCRDESEIELICKAFDFASELHKGATLHSGEPYMLHPLEVAQIVVSDVGLGCKSICAALLHDIPENTDYTAEDMTNLFGEKIAMLVGGLANIRDVLENATPMAEDAVEQTLAKNFKRVLLSMGGDVRVVLIKLADRLSNCRHIDILPPGKAEKILLQIKDIFIPLAHRLGLYGIKSEMENIWLRKTQPSAYAEIESRIDRDLAQRSRDIDEFIVPISKALDAAGMKYEIKKRIKTPYSIWYKMRTKHVSFEQIYDLYAVRIIFENDGHDIDAEHVRAYTIYDIVNKLYKDNPSRYRNWIKEPKVNGYEALHCTLMSKAGIWIEVQIRSRRMDDIAEKGVAAHWHYKNDGYLSESDSAMDRWLAEVQSIISSDNADSLELLDMIHNQIATRNILVFTPKGDQRSIPKDSTALDFAYLIHTDIGNQAIAAKINRRLAPLSTRLRNGDQVEIITARKSVPKPEWVLSLTTGHARRKVLEYLKEHSPEQVALAENLMKSAPGKIPIKITLMGTNRPGLQQEIENALRQIDGIEDVVTSEQ